MAEEAEKTTPEQTQGGGESQQSQAFQDTMAGIQNAIGGIGGNTFDVGEQQEQSSLFNDNTPQQTDNTQDDSGVQSTGDAQPAIEQGAQPQAQGENAVTEQQEQPTEQTEDESNVVSSRITGDVDYGQVQQEEQPENLGFETIDDLEKFLETGEYGITTENIKTELPKLFEASKTLEEANKKVSGYEDVFNNIPKPIYEAIVAWSNGGDWKSPVANHNSTDFTKGFDQHDSKAMVEAYFPGKITAEEWEDASDETGDPETIAKINSYQSLAKDKYELDQQKYNQEIQTYEARAKELNQKAQSAFDESRDNVFKMFEGTPLNVDEKFVNEIDKSVRTQQDVLSIFYNADGTLKPDAHRRIAMALDGESLVTQQANQLMKRAVTKAREEVVRHTADTTPMTKTGDTGSTTAMQEAEQKARAHVQSILPDPDKKTY
jgi:hypothetical protein